MKLALWSYYVKTLIFNCIGTSSKNEFKNVFSKTAFNFSCLLVSKTKKTAPSNLGIQ